MQLLLASFAALMGVSCFNDESRELQCALSGLGESKDSQLRMIHHYLDRTPQWMPDGEAVIVRYGNSIYKVATTDPPLVQRIQAPEATGDPISLQLTPDGRVSYISYEYGGDCLFVRKGFGHGIYHAEIMNQDGTGFEQWPQLRADQPPSGPVWSPDGRHAAFTVSDGLLITDAQGNVVLPDDGRYPVSGPLVWSPDGAHIAYSEPWENERGTPEYSPALGRLSTDRSTLTRVASTGPVLAEPGSISRWTRAHGGWNEAGDQYYFALSAMNSYGRATKTELHVLDTDEPGPELLATVEPPMEIRSVTPSPDGSRLLMVGEDSISGQDLLRVGNIDGSRYIKVCCPPNGKLNATLGAAWSPDGEWIAILHQGGQFSNLPFLNAVTLVRPYGGTLKNVWVEPPEVESPDASNRTN